MDIRKIVPWWAKIIIKIVLSRLNISYRIWQKLRLFRHGMMDEPEYAYNTFLRHYDSVSFDKKGKNFVMLELGPGDSIASGVIAHCFGAKKSYLVDKGDDAIVGSDKYLYLFEFLENKFEHIDFSKMPMSVEDLSKELNIEYLMDGLDSLKRIPDSCIDYLWTQSVLEHIRKVDFVEYVEQFRRIVAKDGVCVHGVDLKDHMSYSHNNLRFSEKLWESDFMASSGFYTNRILFSEMLEIFDRNGFQAEVLSTKKWESLPTARKKMHESFRLLSDEDLLVSEFDVVLRPV